MLVMALWLISYSEMSIDCLSLFNFVIIGCEGMSFGSSAGQIDYILKNIFTLFQFV